MDGPFEVVVEVLKKDYPNLPSEYGIKRIMESSGQPPLNTIKKQELRAMKLIWIENSKERDFAWHLALGTMQSDDRLAKAAANRLAIILEAKIQTAKIDSKAMGESELSGFAQRIANDLLDGFFVREECRSRLTRIILESLRSIKLKVLSGEPIKADEAGSILTFDSPRQQELVEKSRNRMRQKPFFYPTIESLYHNLKNDEVRLWEIMNTLGTMWRRCIQKEWLEMKLEDVELQKDLDCVFLEAARDNRIHHFEKEVGARLRRIVDEALGENHGMFPSAQGTEKMIWDNFKVKVRYFTLRKHIPEHLVDCQAIWILNIGGKGATDAQFLAELERGAIKSDEGRVFEKLKQRRMRTIAEKAMKLNPEIKNAKELAEALNTSDLIVRTYLPEYVFRRNLPNSIYKRKAAAEKVEAWDPDECNRRINEFAKGTNELKEPDWFNLMRKKRATGPNQPVHPQPKQKIRR